MDTKQSAQNVAEPSDMSVEVPPDEKEIGNLHFEEIKDEETAHIEDLNGHGSVASEDKDDLKEGTLKSSKDESENLKRILHDQLAERFPDVPSIASIVSYVEEEEALEEFGVTGTSAGEVDELPGNMYVSSGSTLTPNYLDVEYSFGYDCYKTFNICCPDSGHLVFLSGCFIHILNLKSKLVELRRGSGGQGLGCITMNPKEAHIAIGEKGQNPNIIIYEWPSFDVVSVLKGGSSKQYTCADYSPSGDILASQSGEPDHIIAIWDWRLRQVILKVKSHVQDVFSVRFSQYVTGHLSTSGVGHIKMWRIVNTFTSLKLLGLMGRFGKTTTCDILALYPMPDEKVLSGSEWGNILVWDEGMIKIEVSRKNRRSCHDNEQIVQFLYDPEAMQVTTVGWDGFIRVWNYQTIDLANPPEDDKFVELEPIIEIQVQEGAFEGQLMHIVECPGSTDNTWFGQDRRGGLWQLHIEVSTNLRPSEKIYTTHGGPVIDMATSPRGLFLATLGKYGRLAIWSVEEKRLVLFHNSRPDRIVRLVWLSTMALPSGCAIVAGLASGLVKVLVVRLKEKLEDPEANRMTFDDSNEAKWLHCIQVLKPHTAPVTSLVSNPEGTTVISGSEDQTIFIFAIRKIQEKNLVNLEPIGYVDTLGPVAHLYWNTEESANLLVSCTNGHSMQIQIASDLPSQWQQSSYKIQTLKIKAALFRSMKSKLLREAYMAKVQTLREMKLKRKREKAEEMKKENPSVEIDEYFFYDSQEEIYQRDTPAEFIPPVPNPILFSIPMRTSNPEPPDAEDAVWVSVDGYDAGYLYAVSMGDPKQLDDMDEDDQAVIVLPHIMDVAATCAIKDSKKNHLYVGFANGTIRLIEIDTKSPDNLDKYLQLATHDRQYGRINKLCMAGDGSRLYSVGDDGNVFSYIIQDPALNKEAIPLEFSNIKIKDLEVAIPEEIEKSLEEEKQEIRQGDRLIQIEKKKHNLLSNLNVLQEQLTSILKRLDDIPESIKPPEYEFDLDPRITKATVQLAQKPLELMKSKMRYQIEKSRYGYEKMHAYFLRNVECFYKHVFDTRCERYVTTFTLSKLRPELDLEMESLLSETQTKSVGFELPEEIPQSRIQSKEETQDISGTTLKKPSFLKDLETFKHKLPLRTRRALRKYYESRDEIGPQKPSCEELEKSKSEMENSPENDSPPGPGAADIGNYTLKSDPQYRVAKDKRTTHKKKRLQILKVEKKIYNLKNDFNVKVSALLQEKINLIQKMKQLQQKVLQMQVFIPESFHQSFPSIPCLNYSLEFPEVKFQLEQEHLQEQFEPDIIWNCPELDLIKPPFTESSFSDYSNQRRDSYSDLTSYLEEGDNNDVSQTVFKLDDVKPPEPHFFRPSSPQSQRTIDLPRPMLADTMEDVVGSGMFYSSPDMDLQLLDTSESTLEPLAVSSDVSVTFITNMFTADQQESPLERELRNDTILRLILEQASIAKEVSKSKEVFDKKVEALALERFDVAEAVKLLELFLLTLNEESIVLDRFKGGEGAIQVVIDGQRDKIEERLGKITQMEKQIRTNDEQILRLKEKTRTVETTFAGFNRNLPKYATNYYKLVFNKKMRLGKLKRSSMIEVATRKSKAADRSSVSKKSSWDDRGDRSDYTTSSEEEEDVEGKMDELEEREEGEERRVDDLWSESNPPPGLHPKTLETVIQLRQERHELEEKINAFNVSSNALSKEIENVMNSVKYLRADIEKRNEELDNIITVKQKNLNKVETTVVLKVSQLKNGNNSLKDCIILPGTQLTYLNNRSSELKKQTEAEKKQFHEYKAALSKIKNENSRWKDQYKTLLVEVEEATIKKYGRLVDVAELEEAVLQTLIHEVRKDVPNIVKNLDEELKQKQLELDEEKTDLLQKIKIRADMFQFLVTIQEEKSKLETDIKMINSKKKLEKEKHKQNQSNYEKDIAKLSKIYDTMQHEEMIIMKELCDLTYKGTRAPAKLPPIKKEAKVKTDTKHMTNDRETELKNATVKIKDILEKLEFCNPADITAYNALVEDLKALYGLNDTVDDFVDVLIDLTNKKDESTIGVSNSEVIKATLSMLLLDIEQSENPLEEKQEADAMSVQSDDVSAVEEDKTDIIKVSLQPDDGDVIEIMSETEELSDIENVNESDADNVGDLDDRNEDVLDEVKDSKEFLENMSQ